MQEKQKQRKRTESKKAMQSEILETFKFIDKNGDGYITREEFLLAMTGKETADDAGKQIFAEIMEDFDTDNDGRLNYREWSRMAVTGQEDLEKDK